MVTNIVNNGSIFAAGIQNNQTNSASNANSVNGRSFGDYLKEMVSNTNQEIIKAEDVSNQFAAGKIDDIHKVLIQVEKADVALQFTLQIRNKIMDAYNEIMRMQV